MRRIWWDEAAVSAQGGSVFFTFHSSLFTSFAGGGDPVQFAASV
jgi:hypothetical protein